MSFDIHDSYQRAPFGLIPPRIVKDIKTRLLFDDTVVREIMHAMMGWNYADINLFEKTGDRDPLQKMFDMMNRYEPECVITCSDIDNHFRLKKCFPIIKVHSILKPLTPVCGYLEKEDILKEVVNEIQARRSNPTLYPDAREFKKDNNDNDRFFDYAIKPTRFQWLKNLTRKQSNVLLVNLTTIANASLSSIPITTIESSTSDKSEVEINFEKQALRNLVENLARNFKCEVTPLVVTSEWNEFIDNQFSKTSFIVTAFSQTLLYDISGDSLNSGISFLEGHHKYLWEKITKSEMPTVGVVFDKMHQAEAEKYIMPIFLLPKEMEYLLNFIIEF